VNRRRTIRFLKRRYEAPSPGERLAHLIDHSDAEGYFVPIDFADVIAEDEIRAVVLGSSFALPAPA